jgi:hypothetical protein
MGELWRQFRLQSSPAYYKAYIFLLNSIPGIIMPLPGLAGAGIPKQGDGAIIQTTALLTERSAHFGSFPGTATGTTNPDHSIDWKKIAFSFGGSR